MGLPGKIRLVFGEEQQLTMRQPLGLHLGSGSFAGTSRREGLHKVSLVRPLRVGKSELEVRLFGLILVRRIKVELIPQLEVQVGGQAVGILVSSHGVLVARILPVEGREGRSYPARDAGISPGDVIFAIDDVPIYQLEQLGRLAEEAGRAGRMAKLEIMREGKKIYRRVKPTSTKEGYLLGLEVEDPAAGVER